MLKKLRIALGTLSFALITLVFLDFTGTLHHWFSFLAKIQFLPAVLALNIGVIVALLALTILFGRVYCSIICPLGIMQDLFFRLGNKQKKNRSTYSPAKNWLRYSVLVIFVLAFLLNINALVAILAPYSAYGRIASSIMQPIYIACNNVLAYFAERINSYTFYTTEVWLKSLPTLIVAAITLIIVGVLAWRNGRTYCNTICPVGTILGALSRLSIFKIQIDTEKCNSCGLCAMNCKAACINSKEHEIDYSRCVGCFNCIETCRKGSIKFAPVKHATKCNNEESSVDNSRRKFLATSALITATTIVKAQTDSVDGGLAAIEDKKKPTRQTPIKPCGSVSLANFSKHCTACQLCVSECPNQVLRPSSNLATFMQPEMSYELGYCRPECTRCADVCPTGAILKISKEQKSSTQIGHAVWIADNCLANKGTKCDNCFRHCPTSAISMMPKADNQEIKIPIVDNERCIGCGACENLCPSRPFSAMYVEGNEVHHEN